MSLVPTPNIDQTDLDFDSIRVRMYNLIESVFPNWTSQNVADFGNILVDLYAFVGDVLGFYIDSHARESRIATATQRRSLIALSKLLGYTPRSAAAATVDCTITLEAVPTNDVEFAAGTIARTLDVTGAVEFQLLALATIPALTDPPTVTAAFEHSKTRNDTFAATGKAGQEVSLGAIPFIDTSEVIGAGNGAYSKVANFLSSGSADRHYMVVVDQNDKATIRFGDGTNGALPQGTINATWKIGGGVAGNVDAGMIQKLVGTFTDVMGGSVQASVTNPLMSSGGEPRQSSEEIRREAPESLRALNRTVSREDYEINAKRVPGVARALMLTSNEDARVAENAGNLLVIPSGGGSPSSALITDVETMVTVTYPRTLTFDVTVAGPPFKAVNIEATVYFIAGATPATVAAAIRTSLTNYFALTNADGTENENVGFGQNFGAMGQGASSAVPFSDIYNTVRDTAGVYKVRDQVGSLLINEAASDLSLTVDEFPVLGTVTVINAETGAVVT
jgi:uncharacterized phage protein gp47/JayE